MMEIYRNFINPVFQKFSPLFWSEFFFFVNWIEEKISSGSVII